MKNLIFRGFVALAMVFALPAAIALAQTVAVTQVPSNSVSIPIGAWLTAIASWIMPVIAAVIAWLLRKLPANVVALLKTMQADQLLEKAISYGINSVAGAEKGKTLSIPVGNAVLAEALNYAVTMGPKWLVSWLGGEAAVQQMIVARLSLDAAATVVPIGGSVVIASAPGALASSPSPAAQ